MTAKLATCSPGDVIRCSAGIVKLTGKLGSGWMARHYATGIGTTSEPFILPHATQVDDVLERGQERYQATGAAGAETDPLMVKP